MPKRHEIDISLSSKGEVNIKVQGIDGPGCLDLTKELEEELGVIINREKTSDFYKQEEQQDNKLNLGS